MRAVLKAATAGPEGGRSRRSSGRSPRRRKALVAGWPRWLLTAAQLGLVTGHARGDDGGVGSGSSWLAARRRQQQAEQSEVARRRETGQRRKRSSLRLGHGIERIKAA
jgi:hypothetical protein